MTLKRRVFWAGLLAVLIIAVLCGLFVPRRPQGEITCVIAIAAARRPGMPGAYLAAVTNTGMVPLTLRPPMVQYEDSSSVLSTDLSHSWDHGASVVKLRPGERAELFIGLRKDAKRGRVVIEYSWEADPFRRTVSRGVRLLPLRTVLPDRWTEALIRDGLLDGEYTRHFESQWMPNYSEERNGVSRDDSDVP